MSGWSAPPDRSDRSPVGQLEPAAWRPARSRSRHLGRAVSVVALLAGLAALAVGVQQRQVAAGWQARATAFEDQRDEARNRAAALERQHDEVVEVLTASEADVASLEGRLRQLADEKAQAEDVATTTSVERDRLEGLAGQVAGAVEALDVCVDQLMQLLDDAIDAFNRQGRGESVDVAPLNGARLEAITGCSAARMEAANASAQADRLLR